MRLPFLQVPMELIEARAPELSALLGISLAEALGQLVLLFGIALEKCSDGAPPSRGPPISGGALATLEARVGWKGPERESGAWLEACAEIGVLDYEPGGAFARVRDLNRVSRRWDDEIGDEPRVHVRLKTPAEQAAYREEMATRTAAVFAESHRKVREERQRRFVYFVQAGASGPIKIGYSKAPERRLQQLQVSHPEPLRILATVPGTKGMEGELHARWNQFRLEGEWFSPHASLLAFIASLGKP